MNPEDITDPAIREAAIRFERETGRRLSDTMPAGESEDLVGLFLLVSGYEPKQAWTGEGD